ncbi:universal stress protein [Rhizobacter sp. LjRoot28]|uniref:universal stress protein n=1 Tax=Rhizobacter sp. LjRoot28 TaxID=3342309 RepID=UPI003ECF44BA
MLKVLITVDGSERSLRAIDAVAKWSMATGPVEVLLVNVGERPSYYGDFPPYDAESVDSRLQTAQDALLDAAEKHARAVGLSQVTSEGASGAPAAEIVRLAKERRVDQIAMATHGRTALGGIFLGSVAQRVVHLVDVPVMLVK